MLYFIISFFLSLILGERPLPYTTPTDAPEFTRACFEDERVADIRLQDADAKDLYVFKALLQQVHVFEDENQEIKDMSFFWGLSKADSRAIDSAVLQNESEFYCFIISMDHGIEWQQRIEADMMHVRPLDDEKDSSAGEDVWDQFIILSGKPDNATLLADKLRRIPNVLFWKGRR